MLSVYRYVVSQESTALELGLLHSTKSSESKHAYSSSISQSSSLALEFQHLNLLIAKMHQLYLHYTFEHSGFERAAERNKETKEGEEQ